MTVDPSLLRSGLSSVHTLQSSLMHRELKVGGTKKGPPKWGSVNKSQGVGSCML